MKTCTQTKAISLVGLEEENEGFFKPSSGEEINHRFKCPYKSAIFLRMLLIPPTLTNDVDFDVLPLVSGCLELEGGQLPRVVVPDGLALELTLLRRSAVAAQLGTGGTQC